MSGFFPFLSCLHVLHNALQVIFLYLFWFALCCSLLSTSSRRGSQPTPRRKEPHSATLLRVLLSLQPLTTSKLVGQGLTDEELVLQLFECSGVCPLREERRLVSHGKVEGPSNQLPNKEDAQEIERGQLQGHPI